MKREQTLRDANAKTFAAAHASMLDKTKQDQPTLDQSNSERIAISLIDHRERLEAKLQQLNSVHHKEAQLRAALVR